MAFLHRASSEHRRIRVTTSDGWNLALHHYPRRRPALASDPILLVHGLGANQYNLAAPIAAISLADYLQERGHDVWAISLRGAGDSRPVHWPLKRRKPFDFDDYLKHDIPMVIDRILQETGAPALHWVGHSLGGILAYAAMVELDPSLIRSVVTVGSPLVTAPQHPLVTLAHKLHPILNWLSWLPNRSIRIPAAIFPRLTVQTIGRMMGNPAHLDPQHMKVMTSRALSGVSAPLLRQFARWYSESREEPDGLPRGFWKHLGKIERPILFIAGPDDLIAPIQNVEAAYQAVGSRDKELLVCSQTNGFKANYGHIDPILGKTARREIYPHIVSWIESHRATSLYPSGRCNTDIAEGRHF